MIWLDLDSAEVNWLELAEMDGAGDLEGNGIGFGQFGLSSGTLWFKLRDSLVEVQGGEGFFGWPAGRRWDWILLEWRRDG